MVWNASWVDRDDDTEHSLAFRRILPCWTFLEMTLAGSLVKLIEFKVAIFILHIPTAASHLWKHLYLGDRWLLLTEHRKIIYAEFPRLTEYRRLTSTSCLLVNSVCTEFMAEFCGLMKSSQWGQLHSIHSSYVNGERLILQVLLNKKIE